MKFKKLGGYVLSIRANQSGIEILEYDEKWAEWFLLLGEFIERL